MRIYETYTGGSYVALNGVTLSTVEQTDAGASSQSFGLLNFITESRSTANTLIESPDGTTTIINEQSGGTTVVGAVSTTGNFSSNTSSSSVATSPFFYTPSVSTSTQVESAYTTTVSEIASFTSGTTNSRGQPTTYSSTESSSIFATSASTATVSIWTTTTASFSLNDNYAVNIGTVYECESPFEAIWAYTGGLTLGQTGAYSTACLSTTKFTSYNPSIGESSFTIPVSYGSGTFPPPPTYVVTSGGSFNTIDLEITENSTATNGIATISKIRFGTGDVPPSTQTTPIEYSLISFSTSTSIISRAPVTQTSNFSGTFGIVQTTTFGASYGKLGNNGITTSNLVGAAQDSLTYLFTEITGVPTLTFNTFNTSHTGISSSASGELLSNVVAVGYSTYTPVTDYGYSMQFVSAPDTGISVIMNPVANGVEPYTTSFNISNGIYENYGVSGGFSYIYYPWKSTALPDGNEAMITFTGPRQASYSDTSSHTFQFSYLWSFSSNNAPLYLLVSEEEITSYTTTAGTRTSSISSATGTVSVGGSQTQATSNIYSIEEDNSTFLPLKVGGFGVNTSFPVTWEALPGIYETTGYTFSTNGSLIGSSSGSTSIATYQTETLASNVMSLIHQIPVVIDGYFGSSPGSFVNTYNNSGEMP